MTQTRKLAGPGLFRLSLASLVFLHHSSRFALGAASVYIFFCLSGYWICRMWRGRYAQTSNPYVTYILSRAWRLIPAFVLVGALSVIVEIALGTSIDKLRGSASWAHFILSHVFILGYDSLHRKPMVPAWSLDFEVQFYLLAPIIAIAIVRLKRPWLLLGATALLSLASALWIGPHAISSYLVFFLVGMLSADAAWRPSGRLAFIASAAGLILLAGCLIGPYRGALLVGAHPGPLAIYNQPINVAFALLMCPFAIYTTRQTGFAADGMFADLSYIVYLLHWVGIQILPHYGSLKIPRIALTAVVWAGVYALALVIWRLYDRPLNELRSKWVAARKLGGRRSIRAVEAEAAAP